MVISSLHFIIAAYVNPHYLFHKEKSNSGMIHIVSRPCEGWKLEQKKALNNFFRPSQTQGNNTFISYPHCLCMPASNFTNI